MRRSHIIDLLLLLSLQIWISSGMEKLKGKLSAMSFGKSNVSAGSSAAENWRPALLPDRGMEWYNERLGLKSDTLKWLRKCAHNEPNVYLHPLNEIPVLKKLKEKFVEEKAKGEADSQELYRQIERCLEEFEGHDMTEPRGKETVATFFGILAFITEGGKKDKISPASQDVRKWLEDRDALYRNLKALRKKHKNFKQLHYSLRQLWKSS